MGQGGPSRTIGAAKAEESGARVGPSRTIGPSRSKTVNTYMIGQLGRLEKVRQGGRIVELNSLDGQLGRLETVRQGGRSRTKQLGKFKGGPGKKKSTGSFEPLNKCMTGQLGRLEKVRQGGPSRT